MTSTQAAIDSPGQPLGERTIFGHPTGLFTVFFAEMWERFSFYGMKALLVLYMIKGFLQFQDAEAYTIYGTYTALVYAAPFIGGLLADRLLGARRAVIIGGVLMAAGHLLMTIQDKTAVFFALSLLICGNGFFKPNISAIVGELYTKGSPRRDAGFTIFYMGINLGAAMAPVICGYVGEVYGQWHYGFGLATAGMLIGVAIFAAPTKLTQTLILIAALGGAVAMPMLQDSFLQMLVRIFLAIVLLAAAVAAMIALQRGGLPHEAGRPRDPSRLRRKLGGFLRADLAVWIGIAVAVPVIAYLVKGSWLAGSALGITGSAAMIYVAYDAIFRCQTIERHRLAVVLVLMFFSIPFWALFEQTGTSLNNFTDRNIDRVTETRQVNQDEIGKEITFRIQAKTSAPDLVSLPLLTQEQLGYTYGDHAFTMTDLARLRDEASNNPTAPRKITWHIGPEHVGMGIAQAETPTSEFQAANSVYILLFGFLFTAMWGWLGRRGWEPSTPVKFGLGLLQLGMGFGALWYGAVHADARGMVGIFWLLLSYLLQTTGELCLSPVGLSMVTRLSPARLVSTMMGVWFLATACAQFLAAEIAKLAAVGGQTIPPPSETVMLYGKVFGQLALASAFFAVLCLLLSPLLKRWMHLEELQSGV